MKIIILFSSYVAIINSMVFRETRRTYRPHHNEILEFVQSTSLVKAFNDLLNSSNEFQKINQDSFLRKTTHGSIDLSEHFANTVLDYMNILLKSYCRLALEKLSQNIESKKMITDIQLDKDQDFHVISFLMQLLYPSFVESVFHVMWFFKYLTVQELNETRTQCLRDTINDFYTISDKYKGNQLDDELRAIKKKIMDFSKLFYSPNIPQIVDTNILLEKRNYDNTAYTIKNHIIFFEKFQIIVSTHD